MLTLLPAAVGLSVLGALSYTSAYDVKIASVTLGAVGLATSAFHLGRPRRAWRIFLGWRKSWLSREALVFSGWLGLAGAAVFVPSLAFFSATMGVAGLACSAMIYVDTRRQFWRAAQTFPRFFGTAVLVALAGISPLATAVLLIAKLGWESRTRFDGSASARLQRGPLARIAAIRDGLGLAAAVLCMSVAGWPALTLLLAGELTERYLFFRAVDAPKMPGMPA
jgi:DMSO reductase anchor subunit